MPQPLGPALHHSGGKGGREVGRVAGGKAKATRGAWRRWRRGAAPRAAVPTDMAGLTDPFHVDGRRRAGRGPPYGAETV